jgi:lysophospholipase L1-like esterase
MEFGIIGFGSQGILVGGAGNVPVINSSYNLQFAGTSRAFTPSPNLVIINQGQNDGAANTVSAATTMLNNILAACPNAKIAVLRPFSGNQATNLQNAIAACSDPQRCRYIDTTGFFDTTLSADGIHPYGVANDSIAKKLLPLIKPLIASAYPGGFIGV